MLILFFLITAFNGALFTFQDDLAIYPPPISLFIVWGTGFTLVYLLFAYFILYSLIPKFLAREKYTFFILLLFLGSVFLTVAILFFEYLVFKIFHIPLEKFSLNSAQFPLIRILINFLIYFTCFSSLPITVLLKNWFTDTKKITDLEQIRLQKELKQLKGSINSDFLFDVLDRAGIIAEKEPIITSEIVLKLSKLLRYQLYESSKEKVMLISEIHFLTDFLTLVKLLYKEFYFHIESTKEINIWIPPLLYISLLEGFINEVKNKNISYMNIFVKKNDLNLSFICYYNMIAQQNILWNLKSVKKRLDLLYPYQYELKSEDNMQEYYLQLDIHNI